MIVRPGILRDIEFHLHSDGAESGGGWAGGSHNVRIRRPWLLFGWLEYTKAKKALAVGEGPVDGLIRDVVKFWVEASCAGLGWWIEFCVCRACPVG